MDKYVKYMYTICLDIIFQIFLSCSRPMTSHHVTFHVTAMSCASSLSLKRKRKQNSKEIQKKRNIKSRKIDRRKRKILVSKAFHNTQGQHAIYMCSDVILLISIVHACTMYILWENHTVNIFPDVTPSLDFFQSF